MGTGDDGLSFWRPVFDYEPVLVHGAPWPVVVMVTRWDENDLGERRYVEMRQYRYEPAPEEMHSP